MEASVMAAAAASSSTVAASHYPQRALFQSLLFRENKAPSWRLFSRGFFSPKEERRSLVIAGAKKKKNNKPDTHSFVAKPDEATGPFPEAVLLKKKVVKEDGKALPEFADAEEEEVFEFLSLQLESDLNVERMRHYEVVYLIHEDHLNEVENVISKVQDFIRERKGRIWRLNNWGLRRLAYKIRKAKNANYVLMNFEIEAKCINDLKSMLDQDERIIRHLVIKRDEAITEDCPPPPEFHTLRAEGMDDEEEDVREGEDGDWEEEVELESDGFSGDGYGDNVIVVGEDEDELDDGVRSTRKLKMAKMAKMAR